MFNTPEASQAPAPKLPEATKTMPKLPAGIANPIVASYATNDKTGQLRAVLAPEPQAVLSVGFDALRIRALESGEDQPDLAVLSRAEAHIEASRPACRTLAKDLLVLADPANGQDARHRAALLREALRAQRVACAKRRKAI